MLVSGIRGWTGGPPGLSGLSEPAARVGFSSLCRFRPRVSTVFGAGRPQSPLCPAAAGSAERGIGREHQEGVRGKYRLRFRTSAFYFGVVLEWRGSGKNIGSSYGPCSVSPSANPARRPREFVTAVRSRLGQRSPNARTCSDAAGEMPPLPLPPERPHCI